MKYRTLIACVWAFLFVVPIYCQTLYVSVDGLDSNPGTKASPLRSMEGVGRKLEQKSMKDVSVVFASGIYKCLKTFRIPSSIYSITIRAEKGSDVLLTGAERLSASDFIPVTEQSILNRIHPDAKGKIWVCDLKKKGITDYGDYYSPSPYGVAPTKHVYPLQLFVDGQLMPVARYPNEGWLKVGKVSDRGSISKIDGFKAVQDTTNRGGTFAYDDGEVQRWSKAKDIWLLGFFYWGWYQETVKVAQLDTCRREFHMATSMRYGLGAADNDEPAGYAKGRFSHLRKYFAFNLLEEIDREGEWYLDREDGLLYWWPVRDFASKKMEVSLTDVPFITADNLSNITVEGIHFLNGKRSAIALNRGNNNRILNCTFDNFGETAVTISGYMHRIDHCSFNQCNGCIFAECGDRRSLTPGKTVIRNCFFTHFVGKAVALQGVGIEVSNNEFKNADEIAVNFSGNDHLIQYNVFDSLYLNQGDDVNVVGIGRNPSYQGSLIKNNLFSHIGSPLNNCQAVYLDDGSCGTFVKGNIFYKAGSGHNASVYTNGGSYNIFVGNVFIDDPIAYHLGNGFHNWANKRIVNYLAPDGDFTLALKKEVDINSEVWARRYPVLAHYFEDDPATPKGNVFRCNVVVNAHEVVRGDSTETNVKELIEHLSADNYLLKREYSWEEWKEKLSDKMFNAVVRKHLSCFEPIPIGKIGVGK